jgi:hypothetical protein
VPEQEFLPPRPPGGVRRPGSHGRGAPGSQSPGGSGGRGLPGGPQGPGAPGGVEGWRGPEARGPEDLRGPGDYYGEDPPPWAGLPPVRPARTDYPGGPSQGPAGPPPRPAGPPDPAEPPDDDEFPVWAGPDARDEEDAPRARSRAPEGRVPEGRASGSRAAGGRAQRAAARRRRRWLIALAGLVVVAGSATAGVLLSGGGPPPASVTPGALITTFQPGELQTVPNACGTVPAATVQRYLPGKPKVASPLAIDGAAESACDWTIDQAPVYRLMQLNLLAYAPNGLASGDGSATDAAIDAYATTLADLQDPPKDSGNPRAEVTSLGGLGNEALSAVQVFRRGGAVTDVATVVIRYHNVIVTATVNGLDHSNSGNYGPVSASDLSAAALAFAQAAEATLH